DLLRLEETLRLQVVHQPIGIVGRRVADRALALAEKDLLTMHLGSCRLFRIELAEEVELRRRWEVEQFLKLGHEVDLAAAVEDLAALVGGGHRAAAEVGGPLLELGEVLDRLQRSLRAEQPLDVDAAQRRGVNAVTEGLRADVPDQMRRGIGVPVGVTLETGDA